MTWLHSSLSAAVSPLGIGLDGAEAENDILGVECAD
jgi:hypothetical protein